MHVHLDDELCLEVIVLTGRADELAAAAEHLLSTRGVTHGGLELVAVQPPARARPHAHPHPHPPRAERSPAPKAKRANKKRG
jgi:CopG family nickel-responsive transcriptional regulator